MVYAARLCIEMTYILVIHVSHVRWSQRNEKGTEIKKENNNQREIADALSDKIFLSYFDFFNFF